MTSLSETLIKTLEGLPKYLGSYILGFVVVICTDVIVTSLLIAAILLGFLASPLVAFAAFLGFYAIFGTIKGAARIVASGLQELANAQHQTNQIYLQGRISNETGRDVDQGVGR